jgi:FkbM family methyltransferase
MRQQLKQLYQGVPFKQEFFSALRTVYRPPASIYQHLHFKGVFRVPVGRSSFLIEHNGFQVENSLFWGGIEGCWEGASLALWARLCARSSVVVDVGANTGVYALAAKAVNPQAAVFAFEPVSRVYAKLVANCERNHFDCHPVRKALSNRSGTAKIYDLESDHVYSVTLDKNLHPDHLPVIEREVETVRLDEFLSGAGVERQLDLIKIDVETHEPEVLEGMGQALYRDRPALLVEILNDQVAERIEQLVAPCQFRYFNISETMGPREQQHLTKSDDFNFLLCDDATARALSL